MPNALLLCFVRLKVNKNVERTLENKVHTMSLAKRSNWVKLTLLTCIALNLNVYHGFQTAILVVCAAYKQIIITSGSNMAKRTLIFGNISAGKSALAKQISAQTGQRHIELDELAWRDQNHSIAEKIQVISDELQYLNESGNWIAEGVFGHPISQLCSHSNQVIFLDMPLSVCIEQLEQRYGNELSASDLERQRLWAESYYHRDTANSYAYHSELFDRFSDSKIRISSKEQLKSFLSELATQNSEHNLTLIS
ncbi:conserved hypothetical protein [Vibrio nigripulchritudo MADA3029]|uniref:hypothetical protein n=2 Tax=Vibrio nigripulchritudo TaxID=28173 RepID=UPI0003B1E20B|nr:hypothetical protein [Vibrio nigripulchritudo]CCN45701.1 conserved hypothetical protein [Vibrio nigripulchritudo MADA3020]CCN52956.1 conserved hypothetical protein [Vibrio nigripulchritudo MADA3021]CCN61608.1 conserved hypothetical protein [Vibrio nigripulchritudo MADA3029]BDU37459.1 hypothetical protein TUMSATVNIG2_19280 [Vibrio nigripulchritudo]BDU43179.1 hypothetical protein TUMSATVNIG3_19770 [Vibrio nigripulchritudo]